MVTPEPPKIVDLPSTGPGQQLPKRFAHLLTGCRQQTQDFISPLVDNLFGLVDDQLFECAEKARSNKEQSVYFEAMRTLRLERNGIERRLHRALAEQFNHFIEQRPKTDVEQASLDSSELSLIQQDEHEQVVIITNLASHAEGHCNEALWSLEQRLAVLNQGVKLDHHSNPAAPRALVQGYIQSLDTLNLAAEILKVLYQLFQVEVLNNVEPLYDQLNQYLIDNNILPNLKHGAQAIPETKKKERRAAEPDSATTELPADFGGQPAHTSDQAAPEAKATGYGGTPGVASAGAPGIPGAPGGSAGVAGGAGVPHAAGGPGQAAAGAFPSGGFSGQAGAPGFDAPQAHSGSQTGVMDDQQSTSLLHSITQLLGQRLHLSLPGDTPFPSIQTFTRAPTGSASYSQQELLQALTLLQVQRSEQPEELLSAPVPVIQVKQELVSQLEQASETPLAVAEPDAEMIDLVGMLFDFILDDDELPDQIKALLSHLHTPYLKIALADAALFESHEHPARQLLNLMARAACEWSDHAQNSQAIKQRIEGLVERILQEFEEGHILFNQLLKEFQKFYGQLERQAAIVEQRAVEAAQGRDKLVSARLLADREINETLSKQPLPDSLTRFLRGPWTDVLVFSYLRHGAHSPVWRQALDSLEQLCWSVQPKEDEQEKAQLRRVQPELIHSLTELLSQLGGLQPQQIREQLTPLVALQKAALGLEADTEAQAPPPTSTAPMLGQETLTEEELGVSEEALGQIPDKISAQLAALDFGCWFRFIEGSTSRRLKLAWYSPTTHNYMFVDSAGHRAAVRSKIELAEELANGQAEIIEKQGIPIVDRALKAIHSLLLKFTPGDEA